MNIEDKIEFDYVGVTVHGNREFHFHAGEYFFYTYGDMSGYALRGKTTFTPFEYVCFGTILLSSKEEIKALIEEHWDDRVNSFVERRGKEEASE